VSIKNLLHDTGRFALAQLRTTSFLRMLPVLLCRAFAIMAGEK
jgi:hypothetical protein